MRYAAGMEIFVRVVEKGNFSAAAVELINAIVNPTLPTMGDKSLGTVVKTAAFGAFISLLLSKPIAKWSAGLQMIDQPRNADEIANNPLGLLISDFSWSRER